MHDTSLQTLFGQRVRLLRERRSMTQAQLAERIGVTEQYVGMIERGLSSPSFGVIEGLCQALGTPPSSLFSLPDAEIRDGQTPFAMPPTLDLERFAAHLGYWERNLANGGAFYSLSIRRMFGYGLSEEFAAGDLFLGHTHPEDNGTVHDWIGRLRDGREPANCCFRFLSRGNGVRTGYCQAALERGNDGHPALAYGILIDVTGMIDAGRTGGDGL